MDQVERMVRFGLCHEPFAPASVGGVIDRVLSSDSHHVGSFGCCRFAPSLLSLRGTGPRNGAVAWNGTDLPGL